MPVYLVKGGPSGDRLVDAGTKQAAINHVVGDSYSVKSVTTSEMLELMKSGINVETAAAKQQSGDANG